MQVTHVDDRVDHAVIASKTASSFTVSSSAEFFHILSDTLYSNKHLAVVREVLCNAWDAHIDSGRQDQPVLVTTSDGQLTIQDFGKGIPKDLITDIYCTYGESTKKNDGKQTGGFGLGSKAPFAYAEHFEVISCHAGVKTIYRVSKSSAELGGRPGIIEIVSAPTTETGMRISIPLKDGVQGQADMQKFREYIRFIAKYGEMNVLMDTEKLDVLPFSTAPHNWLLVPMEKAVSSKIHVRYGNVVYPVVNDDHYSNFYQAIDAFIKKLPGNERLSLVFVAPPNSISVVPSREALSMTDFTKATLLGLMEEYSMNFNKLLEVECKKATQEAITKEFGKGNLKAFFNIGDTIPGLAHSTMSSGSYRSHRYDSDLSIRDTMATAGDIVRYFIKYNYPSFAGFKRFDEMFRINYMIQHKLGDVVLLKAYRKMAERSYDRGAKLDKSFFARNIMWPIRKAVLAHPDLKEINLQVLENYESYRANRPAAVDKLRFDYHWKYLPYLRKIVVITHRVSDFYERASGAPIVQKLGSPTKALICVAPRNPAKLAAIREIFTKLDYNIIDITTRQAWEPEEVAVEIVKDDAPKRPKPVGLYPMNKVILVNGTVCTQDTPWDPANRTLAKPEAVIRASKNGHSTLSSFDWPTVQAINRLFGDVIGVAVSTTQENKYIKEGAEPFETYFERMMLHYMSNNIDMMSRLAYIPELYRNHEPKPQGLDHDLVISVVLNDPVLSRKLGLLGPMSQEQRDWLDIWFAYTGTYAYRRATASSRATAIQNILNAVPADANLAKLRSRLNTSPIARYIDFQAIHRAHGTTGKFRENYISRLHARRLILQILKG